MTTEIKDFVGNVLRVGDEVARAVKYGSSSPVLEKRIVESVDNGRLVLEREKNWDGTPSKLGRNTASCDPDKCILIGRPGWRQHHCRSCGERQS